MRIIRAGNVFTFPLTRAREFLHSGLHSYSAIERQTRKRQRYLSKPRKKRIKSSEMLRASSKKRSTSHRFHIRRSFRVSLHSDRGFFFLFFFFQPRIIPVLDTLPRDVVLLLENVLMTSFDEFAIQVFPNAQIYHGKAKNSRSRLKIARKIKITLCIPRRK